MEFKRLHMGRPFYRDVGMVREFRTKSIRHYTRWNRGIGPFAIESVGYRVLIGNCYSGEELTVDKVLT
jgi:hypothetical protein